jgi:hypothetical protein
VTPIDNRRSAIVNCLPQSSIVIRKSSIDLMPYEISFTKPVVIADREQYINECCVGGDVVRDQLLPVVSGNYENIDTEQEDWGWFIWFRKGPVRLAIDIFTDDSDAGSFRVHLTSRKKRILFSNVVVDTSELDILKDAVVSQLANWGASAISVVKLDEHYLGEAPSA